MTMRAAPEEPLVRSTGGVFLIPELSVGIFFFLIFLFLASLSYFFFFFVLSLNKNRDNEKGLRRRTINDARGRCGTECGRGLVFATIRIYQMLQPTTI